MDTTTAHQIIAELEEQVQVESEKPFVVSIMGQTGVGKSSLLNALFDAQLRTDPVRPCTKEIQRVPVTGQSGRQLWFYDLPGLGESRSADERYLVEYRQLLAASDVVLWAIHCDNRSVTFDRDALSELVGIDRSEQADLMSKITFALCKVDLLTPPPWVFGTQGESGVFAPTGATRDLLKEKQAYYQDEFIRPLGDLITAHTYNDGSFNISEGRLSFDEHSVTYRGLLSEDELTSFKRRFPDHASTFERLYDNYRVIPCSSSFRYNLTQLLLVIVNKLGHSAIGRFSNFVSASNEMDRVAVSEASGYRNFVEVEMTKTQVGRSSR